MASNDTVVMKSIHDDVRFLSLTENLNFTRFSARKKAMQILMNPESNLSNSALEKFREGLNRIIERDLGALPDRNFWKVKNEISQLATRVDEILAEIKGAVRISESKVA